MTPLMLAAMSGHRKIVAMLLEHGADPRLETAKGMTARDYAANIKAQAIIDMLDAAAAGP